MKKVFVLVVMAMLIGSVTFADEAIIIDFVLLQADIMPSDGDGAMTENRRTLIDFAYTAGDSFSDEQKALMKSSLGLSNWEVILNSSARTPTSVAASQVKAAPVREEARVPFAGQSVMGVRILFPESANNANAYVKPPFTIPGFEPMRQVTDDGEVQDQTPEEKAAGVTRFEEGYGVVKNVGTIRSLAVTTMGNNFPHALYVVLSDENAVKRRYYMGNLNFDGWRELIWLNPNYITDVRKRELRLVPLYPVAVPFVKFDSFYVTRDAMDMGGDFIAYFKDVKMIYDRAVLTTERDIVDDDVWGIFSQRESEKQSFEMTRFGTRQVEIFMEKQKQATEASFTPSLTVEGEGAAAEAEADVQ